MIISPTVVEIYFTCYALLLVGPILIRKFKLRPSTKLQLTRVLFLACIVSPFAVRLVEPPKSKLLTNFVSLDDKQEVGTLNTIQQSVEPRSFFSRPSLRVQNIENYHVYLLILWFAGALWHFILLTKDLKKIRSILRQSWHLRSFGAVKVKVSDQCGIPFSVRVTNGAYIVLPTAMLNDPSGLKIAIAHEGQHHRQGDCLFAYLFEAVKILFYWNPGIWQWKKVISELQEFSCDEALVGHQIVSAHDYGRCLLKVAQTEMPFSRSYQRELACAVGMAQGFGSKQQSILRRRIEMFSEYQSSFPKRMLLKSSLACLALGTPICAAYAARSMKESRVEKIDISSVDPKIQEIAEHEIIAAVKRYKAKSGAVAVADAKSGRILAFAEKRADSSLETWATRPFAPASTIKPFVAAAAVDAGLATEEKKYDCRQPYVVGGEEFVNYEDRFNDMSLTEAIAKSVNVCMIKVGQEIGLKKLKETLNHFGFDADHLTEANESGDLQLAKLTLGETIPVSMATMIKAYSILANNGHTAQSTVISEATAKSVQRMLVNAVNDGTGKRAALSGLVVGGKTGTLSAGTNARSADLDASPFFGLFGGYVATKDSPLVAFVLIEEGHRTNDRHEKAGGGVVAAPVFHEVMKKSLEVLK